MFSGPKNSGGLTLREKEGKLSRKMVCLVPVNLELTLWLSHPALLLGSSFAGNCLLGYGLVCCCCCLLLFVLFVLFCVVCVASLFVCLFVSFASLSRPDPMRPITEQANTRTFLGCCASHTYLACVRASGHSVPDH